MEGLLATHSILNKLHFQDTWGWSMFVKVVYKSVLNVDVA